MLKCTRQIVFLATVGLLILAACAPKPEKIMVSPENIQLTAQDATAQLTAEPVDKNGARVDGVTITWSSADEAVAKVDSQGKVSVVGSGKTTITAKADALSADVAVTVSIPSSLKVDKDKLSFTDEMTSDTLAATVVDEKGNPWMGEGKVAWASADTAIATVDEGGMVTGVAPGNTMITATFKDLKVDVAVESTMTAPKAVEGAEPAAADAAAPAKQEPAKAPTKSIGGKKTIGGERHR